MTTDCCLMVKLIFFSCIKICFNIFLILESMADRIKNGGSKKKPDNIKFPPYAKKPQTTTPKKEDCGETVDKEEENVGEEGDDSSTTAATTTTTTKAPPPSSSSDGDSVSISAAEEESSVAEAKPVGKIGNSFANFVFLITILSS